MGAASRASACGVTAIVETHDFGFTNNVKEPGSVSQHGAVVVVQKWLAILAPAKTAIIETHNFGFTNNVKEPGSISHGYAKRGHGVRRSDEQGDITTALRHLNIISMNSLEVLSIKLDAW